MLKYSADDVVAALKGGKNLNAAIKNVLKREIGNDTKAARFLKELRGACESSQEDRARLFIEQHVPAWEGALFMVFRYGFPEVVAKVLTTVSETYADTFNATYQKNGEGIEITDRAVFNRIIAEVKELLPRLLGENGAPVSGFTVKALTFFVFDAEVLREVLPLLDGR